jgi:hypothetical protein
MSKTAFDNDSLIHSFIHIVPHIFKKKIILLLFIRSSESRLVISVID